MAMNKAANKLDKYMLNTRGPIKKLQPLFRFCSFLLVLLCIYLSSLSAALFIAMFWQN